MKTVLSLCDHSGVMVEPWAKAGYECIIVDLLHPLGSSMHGNITRVRADVLQYLPPRKEYAAAFAFPVCRNLAVSGARWFKEKGLRGLIEGLELVERCMPAPKPVEPTEGSKMHLMAPSEDREQKRSVTPAGFSKAVFEANHKESV